MDLLDQRSRGPSTPPSRIGDPGHEDRVLPRHGQPVHRSRRRAGVSTREIGDGIVIDFDADGHPVGIDIDQASKHLDLRTLDLTRFPLGAEKVAG